MRARIDAASASAVSAAPGRRDGGAAAIVARSAARSAGGPATTPRPGQRHALPGPGTRSWYCSKVDSDTATGPLLPDGRSRMSTSHSRPSAPGAVIAATTCGASRTNYSDGASDRRPPLAPGAPPGRGRRAASGRGRSPPASPARPACPSPPPPSRRRARGRSARRNRRRSAAAARRWRHPPGRRRSSPAVSASIAPSSAAASISNFRLVASRRVISIASSRWRASLTSAGSPAAGSAEQAPIPPPASSPSSAAGLRAR